MKTACYNILIKEMEVMSMKNKKMKSGGLLTLAFLMAAGNVMPALAGFWEQGGGGGIYLAAGCSRMALEKR